MEFKTLIEQRRSLRALAPVEISDAVIHELAATASRAPSCSNKQPWRFTFVRSPGALEGILGVLAAGNAAWAKRASLVIVVWSLVDLDCRMPDGRDYYQFDTGMATSLLLLAATERNLVTHPIAGFDPQGAREVLSLPAQAQVITLIIVGGHSGEIPAGLTDWQIKAEEQPSPRMRFEEFANIV